MWRDGEEDTFLLKFSTVSIYSSISNSDIWNYVHHMFTSAGLSSKDRDRLRHDNILQGLYIQGISQPFSTLPLHSPSSLHIFQTYMHACIHKHKCKHSSLHFTEGRIFKAFSHQGFFFLCAKFSHNEEKTISLKYALDSLLN